MWEERLDRIEALIEKIGNRVDSNARAIEALTSAAAQERTQRQRAEHRLYESMARMSDLKLLILHFTISKKCPRITLFDDNAKIITENNHRKNVWQ